MAINLRAHTSCRYGLFVVKTGKSLIINQGSLKINSESAIQFINYGKEQSQRTED